MQLRSYEYKYQCLLLHFTDTGTWNHYVDSKVSSEDC